MLLDLRWKPAPQTFDVAKKTKLSRVNLAGAPLKIPYLLPDGTAGPESTPQQAGPVPLCHEITQHPEEKCVDDLAFLESINLRRSLVASTPIICPSNLNEQPGLHIPPEQSILQP